MDVKLSPKEKRELLEKQAGACLICGGKLKIGDSFFQKIENDESSSLPALDQNRDDDNIKAICSKCHYERMITENVSKASGLIKEAEQEDEILTTGGYTVNVKDSKNPKKGRKN